VALRTQRKRFYHESARWGIASVLILVIAAMPSLYGAENEDPWDFLNDFRHVEGAIRPIDERHVAALFFNSEKQLRALVVFPTHCEGQRCSLEHPVAYSVFDSRGLVVRSHENRGEEFLLQRVLTSASTAYSAT
jgi:hypothetical protein